MATKLEKLRDKLKELFQINQADLDFGIYRILNAKHDEIVKFLDVDLLIQIKSGLENLGSKDISSLKKDLEEAIKQAKDLGMNPDDTPKVKDLKLKLGAEVDLQKEEDDIYSHLYSFFSRYYKDGDFMSMRRYKEGVYAIPYEGEEVKLYWANHDQYYIKSSEFLRDYTFKIVGDKKVHFKIVEADEEKNNNKSLEGKERRFVLDNENPFYEEAGELFIRFEFISDESKKAQKAINEETIKNVLDSKKLSVQWKSGLAGLSPTEGNPRRTILEKHLNDYTAKYEFDYFIHKDLGGFLRRELDFYIKNEVMHLDDVENEEISRVEQYLLKIKVIRKIAHKLIDFLAQLENFQKKLWLKKKFVIETNYCITLDRVSEKFYDEIAGNDKQWDEWKNLGFLETTGEIKESKQGELFAGKKAKIKTRDYLKQHPCLVLDTKFFNAEFKDKLLTSIEDFDEQCDGLLIHSENFQALNLLQERYREQVKCIYIDPPYNTGNDGFAYKDGYQHSTWISMLKDRLLISRNLLREEGANYTQIDYYETHRLRELLDSFYFFQRELIWDIQVLSGFKTIAPNWIRGHETIYFHTKSNKYFFNKLKQPHSKEYEAMFNKIDENGRKYMVAHGTTRYWDEIKDKGKPFGDVWSDVMSFQQQPTASERIDFSTQKPEKLLERIILSSSVENEIILDFFAGSGTVGAAAQKMKRKYILIEMGQYFNSIMLPRMKKTLNGFISSVSKTSNYLGGGTVKYIRLESYEDCLNNLELKRSEKQNELLLKSKSLKEDYMLHYMLDVESKGSILNLDAFSDPFNYQMNIATGTVGETKPVNIDLVETFNYLIGLKIKHIDNIKSVKVITGTNLKGERILVIWRKIKEMNNNALDKWFEKQGYNTQDMEYDIIYVNGDNNLENLKKDEHTWKVRLIEEEFHRLMFEGAEA